MLIKLQKHRYSDDYMIIENLKSITYTNMPQYYYSEDDLHRAMLEFINMPRELNELRSVWYCDSNPLLTQSCQGPHAVVKAKWPSGYKINRISFVNANGHSEVILFDGEAYICNDEGRTVQKVKRGGVDTPPVLGVSDTPPIHAA